MFVFPVFSIQRSDLLLLNMVQGACLPVSDRPVVVQSMAQRLKYLLTRPIYFAKKQIFLRNLINNSIILLAMLFFLNRSLYFS